MDAHFRAFSFVDRIISVHEGKQIRGRYTIPPDLHDFPLSLVGEAVGQLAAWAAMAAVGFEQRPVAGLAGRIELIRAPRAGQVLELAADLESVDADGVAYSGTAHAEGAPVLSLADCVGPMVPVADFDDPQALKARYEQLCGPGVTGGSAPHLPHLDLKRAGGEPGQWAAANLQVPAEAPLFADHFPRRHVFPGSLLMHANLQLGVMLASELPPPDRDRWVPTAIQDMKLRSFIAPGMDLRIEARLKQLTPDTARLALETRNASGVVATAGLRLKPGNAS